MAVPLEVEATERSLAPVNDSGDVNPGFPARETDTVCNHPVRKPREPYAIERWDADGTLAARLVGPGLISKWYADENQIKRLEDLRDLMNYAVMANTRFGGSGQRVPVKAYEIRINNEVNHGNAIGH